MKCKDLAVQNGLRDQHCGIEVLRLGSEDERTLGANIAKVLLSKIEW